MKEREKEKIESVMEERFGVRSEAFFTDNTRHKICLLRRGKITSLRKKGETQLVDVRPA